MYPALSAQMSSLVSLLSLFRNQYAVFLLMVLVSGKSARASLLSSWSARKRLCSPMYVYRMLEQ